MKKNYVLIPFLVITLAFTQLINAQSSIQDIEPTNIEGLIIYPNPVSHGKLYITTKQNLTKDIEIFNVLGNRIYTTTLFGKELNVSKLHAGVYILKISENNISTTRKLVIK